MMQKIKTTATVGGVCVCVRVRVWEVCVYVGGGCGMFEGMCMRA